MEHGAEKVAAAAQPVEEVPLTPVPTGPIPDGGLTAWLQVAGSFLCCFNSWGIVNSFGVFQTYYVTELLKDSSSPGAISWIGSVQSFLLLGMGVLSGPLFDAGLLKSLIAVAVFCITLGFMMNSLATQYWQIFLAQGICMGLGAGCLITPSFSLLPQYFERRRALAVGIAVVGSSLGGVIYPLVFQGLVTKIGFAWTNRVIGFMCLATLSFSLVVMRARSRPRQVRSLIDPSAFRETPYLLFCGTMIFCNFGFFAPIFYLQTYAMSHGVTDNNLALNLVAILNAGSILGRLAPALAVPKLGPTNVFLIVASVAAIVAFSWIAVDTTAGNVVFAIMYGFWTGGIVSLPSVILASITEDLRFMGARLGVANLMNGLAALVGPPIAGALLSARGDYLGVQLFNGFILATSACFLTALRISRTGWKLKVKI
ncbi:riboflavin transporter MCH5 [Thozetella sp. PMI_491]|nr:riboflavin transporter MCH5 [Thozetella sp. PMI_491]